MKHIKTLIDRYILSESLPLEARKLNLVCFVGLVAILVAFTARMIIFANSSLFNLILFVCPLTLVAILLTLSRLGHYRVGVWLVVILLGDVLFPLNFFRLGGASGGMLAFFVLSVVVTFLLCGGRDLIILLVMHFLIVGACYGAEALAPGCVTPITPMQQTLDSVQSFFVVGLFIGLMIKFQRWLFLSEQRKADDGAEALSRRDDIMRAVNQVAGVLLSQTAGRFEDALARGVGLLADCVRADRVLVWKNRRDADGLRAQLVYGWDRGSGLRHGEEEIFYAENLPSWEHRLGEGLPVNGTASDFGEIERAFIEGRDALAVMALPIFLKDGFWGFISFSDRTVARRFPTEEMDVLQSGCLLLANAVARNELLSEIEAADAHMRLMLNAMPLACLMWDETLRCIDCNAESLQLFNVTEPKERFIGRFFTDFSPEYQPDGQLSAEQGRVFLETALRTGRCSFEWLHQDARGTAIPCEIVLTRLKYGSGYVIASYCRDMREAKRLMENIRHQDALLHVINDSAAILLNSDVSRFEQDLWQCFGLLASRVGVDRIYVWRNHIRDGVLYSRHEYEWSAGGTLQQSADIEMDIPFSENVPGWAETLSAGACVNGIVRTFSEEVQFILEPQGIVSILVVPVFLNQCFWGYLGFDDCNTERRFSPDEETILSSAGLLVANAMRRNESERLLNSRLARQEMTATVSQSFIGEGDPYMPVRYALRQVGAFFGASRVFIAPLPGGDETIRPIGVGFDDARNAYDADETPADVAAAFAAAGLSDFSDDPSAEGGASVLCCDDLRADARYAPLGAAGLSGFVRAPLIVGRRCLGLFFIETRAKACAWTEDDEQLISVIVNTVAGSLAREISERRRDEALDTAMKASKAKGDFLSNMSHEMRTPMNAIIGMTSIGKSAADIEKKDYAFGKIEDASTHLLGVINDILDMSKIEANKLELSVTAFNFEKMLQKVENVISFRVEEKHQELRITVDPDIPAVLVGDDQRLAQVITNLLSNAVKFTPEEGFVSLSARLEDARDGVYTLRVDVTDSGIGISPEQQARLFTNFEQAESGTSRKFGGTGLGLAISKRIVEMMGGEIWIESELGEGATFAFTLKATAGAEDARGAEDADAQAAPDAADFEGYHILLAEDVDINREIVMALLEPTRLSIDCAVNGKEAARMFTENADRYDMIFMDVQMPEMDGYTATRSIRALGTPKAENIPIVAMTANVFREDIERCLESGMNDHVGKPLDLEEVLARLRRYLPANPATE